MQGAGAVERPALSVVFPCLDEAATVGACVAEARAELSRAGLAGEVLVADNGSVDGSPRIAEDAGARVVPVRRRGYGAAMLGGIEAARAELVLVADADLSYDLSSLGAFYALLAAGDELVVGCRLPSGGGRIEPGAMPPLHRYLGNPVLSGLGRRATGARVRDFHCGIRGLRREAVLALELRCPGMELASEMIARAAARGLRISELPVVLRPDGRPRRPHLRPFADGVRHLRVLADAALGVALFSPR